MEIEKFIFQIEEIKTKIGKDRDKLDELISKAESLLEDCIEAYDLLDQARDALSRLV